MTVPTIAPPTILGDIKKVLGIDPSETGFDVDILMHIATAVSTLTQLGIGPLDLLVDETTAWSDFIGDSNYYVSAKSYLYVKVKTVFDPPASGQILAAQEAYAKEIEWRLEILAQTPPVPVPAPLP
jgi:hypothetical protein